VLSHVIRMRRGRPARKACYHLHYVSPTETSLSGCVNDFIILVKESLLLVVARTYPT
jgi:hypothetical protein